MVVVLWLTPAEPARGFFRETIWRLAAEQDGPVFAPHLTLGLGSAEQLSALQAAPIELPMRGLNWSNKFTKTLFVRFEITPALARLRESFGMAAAPFDPHLSLLYREMPDAAKRLLASSLALPFSSVVFDGITAVRCPAKTNSRAEVESWETIASQPLG